MDPITLIVTALAAAHAAFFADASLAGCQAATMVR
jgi:hypothetical protein